MKKLFCFSQNFFFFATKTSKITFNSNCIVKFKNEFKLKKKVINQ